MRFDLSDKMREIPVIEVCSIEIGQVEDIEAGTGSNPPPDTPPAGSHLCRTVSGSVPPLSLVSPYSIWDF